MNKPSFRFNRNDQDLIKWVEKVLPEYDNNLSFLIRRALRKMMESNEGLKPATENKNISPPKPVEKVKTVINELASCSEPEPTQEKESDIQRRFKNLMGNW